MESIPLLWSANFLTTQFLMDSNSVKFVVISCGAILLHYLVLNVRFGKTSMGKLKWSSVHPYCGIQNFVKMNYICKICL